MADVPTLTVPVDHRRRRGHAVGCLYDRDRTHRHRWQRNALVDGQRRPRRNHADATAATRSPRPVGVTSVDITDWNLDALRLTAPADSDQDFTLTVTARATESANGDEATSHRFDRRAGNRSGRSTVAHGSRRRSTWMRTQTVPRSRSRSALTDTDGSETLAAGGQRHSGRRNAVGRHQLVRRHQRQHDRRRDRAGR